MDVVTSWHRNAFANSGDSPGQLQDGVVYVGWAEVGTGEDLETL